MCSAAGIADHRADAIASGMLPARNQFIALINSANSWGSVGASEWQFPWERRVHRAPPLGHDRGHSNRGLCARVLLARHVEPRPGSSDRGGGSVSEPSQPFREQGVASAARRGLSGRRVQQVRQVSRLICKAEAPDRWFPPVAVVNGVREPTGMPL